MTATERHLHTRAATRPTESVQPEPKSAFEWTFQAAELARTIHALRANEETRHA